MNGKVENKKLYLDARFYYCLVVAVFVFFTLVTVSITHKNNISTYSESIPFEEDWYYDDGKPVNFSQTHEEIHYDITKTIGSVDSNNKSLCFTSKNVYFSVYLDGNRIYDFHPKSSRLIGRSYGIFPHAVSLPVLHEGSKLTISIDNLYDTTYGFVKDLELTNGNVYLTSEQRRTAPEFMLCTVVFALGMIAFVIGMAGRYFGDRRYEIISMGTFAMVSALWISSETSFFPLLLNEPIAIHFLDYMMLAILPLPTVLFASFVTGNKDSNVGMIIGVLSALNMLAQILLTSFGLFDYHQLLFISHILLGLTVLSVIYLFIRSVVLDRMTKELVWILTISFIGPLLFGVFELIRYRISPKDYSGTPIYQYILFLFIFLCCVYEFISISEMSRKGQYAEIMEKLAYNDSLTGLYNREAYNKFVDAKHDKDSCFTFIMLDMNYLKKVNDICGHAVGDEYIKTLATYIKDSFEGKGDSYRMGGDEFLVISKLSIRDPEFQNCINTLNKKVEDYNLDKQADIPLSVAMGYSEYHVGESSIKDILKDADVKMYERKKEMKENNNI